MKKYRRLLTRGNLFAAEGLPYDYARVQREEEALSAEREKEFPGHCLPQPDLGGDRSERRHLELDLMTEVDSSHRSEDDLVKEWVFDGLSRTLKSASAKINNVVNKFIAHSATPESRAMVSDDELTVLVGDVWSAQETICRVARTVSWLLLNSGDRAPLLMSGGNQFECFDRPLVDTEHLSSLNAAWEAFHRKVSGWVPYHPSDIRAKSASPPA
jgi:hypothetical protein